MKKMHKKSIFSTRFLTRNLPAITVAMDGIMAEVLKGEYLKNKIPQKVAKFGDFR